MTCGEVDIWLVAGITPDVITDSRVHVLTRGVQVFLVALDLVDESTFGDRNANVVLLPALLRGWRWRITCKSAHMTDRLLPEFTMRSASAFAQISQLFVRDINAWMNAHQLRPESRLARSHQLDQRMLALEFVAR